MSIGAGDFSYRATADGEVAIRRGGSVVTVLRGSKASAFLARVSNASVEDQQLEMARATGNYRRGNERAAAAHPRNRRP
jgi:hypothetical protein